MSCSKVYVDEVICEAEGGVSEAEGRWEADKRTKTKSVVKRRVRWYFLRREYSIHDRA